jgi:putative colanic acid biosynthesis acetyltransferase WcaF
LAKFPPPQIEGDRGLAVKALWYLCSALFFRHALALLPSAAKAGLLRAFGAAVGGRVVIKPSVSIKYPWQLAIGPNSWIGERVWIDNPGPVRIGADVCVSQGVYIVTGNHDFTRPGFDFFAAPVEVGDRAWLCARAILPPGSVVPPGTVVPIGSVWRNPSASRTDAP